MSSTRNIIMNKVSVNLDKNSRDEKFFSWLFVYTEFLNSILRLFHHLR
jgi:hypothetical protein